jgi:hypothetical protein
VAFLIRRLVLLLGGLTLYAGSMVLVVQAGLGVFPWDVLHQGIALRTGWSLGTVIVVVGAVVLALWGAMRQRPGFGTVANVVVIGVATDAFLLVVPPAASTPRAITMLVAGVVLNAVATAAYIGARWGAGPRDGLMTGLVARTGWPVRVVRGGIEVLVVALGWLLGGVIGVGTVVYALAIGPLVQPMLPWFDVRARGRAAGPAPGRRGQAGCDSRVATSDPGVVGSTT